jgi:hypothetical protein
MGEAKRKREAAAAAAAPPAASSPASGTQVFYLVRLNGMDPVPLRELHIFTTAAPAPATKP